MTDKKAWLATGAGSIGLAEQEVADLQQQIGTFRDPSASLAPDDPQSTGNRR